MLVLTRGKDQSITVAESIVITVLGVQNGRVRLGIEAPTEVSVLRTEVGLRMQPELALPPE